MTEIIILHQELILANRLAHIRHDLPDLGPSMHAVAVIVPLVPLEFQLPTSVTPRLDAQFFVRVAEPLLIHRQRPVIVRIFAAGHAPAVFGQVLAARDALVNAHSGFGGTASPDEGVDLAELVGVVFEVHVGGDLGLRVSVEVVGGAGAGGLAQGVEVPGPPDRVPDLEVLEPVALVDGARVGSVPGLVQGVVVYGGFGRLAEIGRQAEIGLDGSGSVEDSRGDAIEDTDGAVGGVCDFGGGDDGDCWAGGRDWFRHDFIRESLGRDYWRKRFDRSLGGD